MESYTIFYNVEEKDGKKVETTAIYQPVSEGCYTVVITVNTTDTTEDKPEVDYQKLQEALLHALQKTNKKKEK